MTYLNYLERLASIEQEEAEKQAAYQLAAEAAVRTEKEYELRFAKGKLKAEGKTQDEKKDKVLVAIAAADDDLYERYVDSQAKLAGLKAAMKTLESRAMVGMALLKAQQREIGG